MHEIHLDTVDSTQLYAKKNAPFFPKDQITCITAEMQTAGRGRYMRNWVSPLHLNIYATFYFTLEIETLHLSALAQLLSYSLSTILIEDHFQPKIKWPNDIQINGKKLAGVLCETCFHKEHVEIFLGIGINVNMPPLILAQVDQPATSLFAETNRVFDKKEVLKRLQIRFAENLELFKKEGFTSFHQAFENLLAHKGQTICCFDGKKEWVGICHSLAADGRLNLHMPDNTLRTITSGDLSR